MKNTILTILITAAVVLSGVYLFQNYSIIKNNAEVVTQDVIEDTAMTVDILDNDGTTTQFTPSDEDWNKNGCLMYNDICYVESPDPDHNGAYVPEGVDFFADPEGAAAANAEVREVIRRHEEVASYDEFGKIYISEELGYKLTVPDEWLKYNYYVEFEYTGGGSASYESWEDIYYADFGDWERFELFRIGSANDIVFKNTIEYYESLSQMCKERRSDPTYSPGEYCDYDMTFEPYYAQLGEDIAFAKNNVGTVNEGVFYSYRVWHDSPDEFINDSHPLPDLETDFEIVDK